MTATPCVRWLDDRKVMSDEQQGRAQLVLQPGQQVDDLRLHRHVKCGDRLVADDQIGAGRQRGSNPDARPPESSWG